MFCYLMIYQVGHTASNQPEVDATKSQIIPDIEFEINLRFDRINFRLVWRGLTQVNSKDVHDPIK